MTNHPNRNWRRRMHAACADWLSRWPWRAEPGARLVTDAELQDLMRQAYYAGYEAGRKPA